MLLASITYFSHKELKCSNCLCSVDGDFYITVIKPVHQGAVLCLVIQSCPTLMDCSLPGSSVHGIL